MIEKLVNSKTRLKILKLFLSNINDRYYLRELERLLDESLSPLRRQLVKLTNIGILMVEEEANLKYYRLNKNFERLEELKRFVLEEAPVHPVGGQVSTYGVDRSDGELAGVRSATSRQFRYDLALLSFISVFVLITAIFVVYTNNKNIKQVTKMIAGELLPPTKNPTATSEVLPASNGEMMSRRWKVMPGNIPVLSSGETGEEKNSKEL